MAKVKLIVMCGLPGSGKSTYAKKLAKKEHAQIISSDVIRERMFGDASIQTDGNKVFGRLYYLVSRSLKYRKSVIVDCINPRPSDRKRYLRYYENQFDESMLVYISTPIEECKRRNRLRERVVPDEAIEKQAAKFIEPTEEEGFDVLEVV